MHAKLLGQIFISFENMLDQMDGLSFHFLTRDFLKWHLKLGFLLFRNYGWILLSDWKNIYNNKPKNQEKTTLKSPTYHLWYNFPKDAKFKKI